MHTVELLEEAIELAERAGFEIRREVLNGTSGGACRVGGRWRLYLDPSQPAPEQLTQVVGALRQVAPPATGQPISNQLRSLICWESME